MKSLTPSLMFDDLNMTAYDGFAGTSDELMIICAL